MMRAAAVFVALIMTLGLAVPAAWAEEDRPDQLVDKSRIVVKEMTASQDRGVPEDLLRKAAGVAIVPALYKGGFFVGGAYGRGIVLAHRSWGWSGPAFLELAMGSFGLQFGGEKIELIMVIMGEKTLDAFLRNKFQLGADVAIAAGPVGARASGGTDIALKGGIFSYSRTKGLFAGISLEGGFVDSRPTFNEAYYKADVSTRDILDGKVTVPASGQKLIQLLGKFR
jgi:lipid-binding SYLF domain-containing protein